MNTYFEIKYEKLNNYFDKRQSKKEPTVEELIALDKMTDKQADIKYYLLKKGVKVCDLQLTQR